MPVSWITALRGAAAVTWRSLLANFLIVGAAVAASLALGREIRVRPEGVVLAFDWSPPFAVYVAVAQTVATVWAVKRSVEVALFAPSLSISQSLTATWSFAWRHFIAVFSPAAVVYGLGRLIGDGAVEHIPGPALGLLAIWTIGPSLIWAIRGMLRVQAQRIVQAAP